MSAGERDDAPAGACYLCGGRDFQALIEVERHLIRRCPQCGLGATVGAGQASYNGAYLQQQWTGADPSPEQVERAVRAELPYVRRIERLARGRRLLEIGAGHGYFLEAARRRGYEVQGIDISSAAAEFCQARFGLPVLVSAIEEADLPDGSFDVVAAWHVLEHLADPRAALRKARAWLAPAGVLAVEVPNYESYDARTLGADWPGWQPRYHRWHFTPGALARLLRETGFAASLMWSPPSGVARDRLKRIPVIGLFRRALWRFYPGTGVAAIARR